VLISNLVSNYQSVKKVYRGIIFDIDGTITRTSQLIYDTFNFVTKKYINKIHAPREILAMFGPPEDFAIKKLVDSSDYDSAMEDFYFYYRQHHNKKAELHDGMLEILDRLHNEKIPLGVFTGKGRKTTEITLEEFGLTEYFCTVITGHDVKRYKPSGEGLQLALKEMNIAASDALMIGDSVADVKAARDAGVDIASVLWDMYSHDKTVTLDADYRFLATNEFRRWIDEFITMSRNNNTDETYYE
jgi:pyrophosphatase PpaX